VKTRSCSTIPERDDFLPSELDFQKNGHAVYQRHVPRRKPERFGQEGPSILDFMPEIHPVQPSREYLFSGCGTTTPGYTKTTVEG
jgi:hypothetical protein